MKRPAVSLIAIALLFPASALAQIQKPITVADGMALAEQAEQGFNKKCPSTAVASPMQGIKGVPCKMAFLQIQTAMIGSIAGFRKGLVDACVEDLKKDHRNGSSSVTCQKIYVKGEYWVNESKFNQLALPPKLAQVYRDLRAQYETLTRQYQ